MILHTPCEKVGQRQTSLQPHAPHSSESGAFGFSAMWSVKWIPESRQIFPEFKLCPRPHLQLDGPAPLSRTFPYFSRFAHWLRMKKASDRNLWQTAVVLWRVGRAVDCNSLESSCIGHGRVDLLGFYGIVSATYGNRFRNPHH